MTAALEWGEWSAARLGRTLPLGKTRYPFYRRLGGPQGWSGWAGAIQYSIQPTTSERLLHGCKLLLSNTVSYTDPTLRLHTKDTPSHRRRFFTHNLNGTDPLNK